MSVFDFDAIVVGQGLAGTALAWNLTWRHQRVLVIDRDEPVTSSRVAAGLMTPITGKKLVPSWRWERFWNSATTFYRRVEQQTSSAFFYPQRIVRLLAIPQEQQYFAKRVESELAGLIQQPEPLVSAAEFDDSLGGFEMIEGGRLAVLAYLAASREYFQSHDAVLKSEFDLSSDVELTANGIRIPRLEMTARRLIFCQGIDATSNRWFQNMDFKPAKGEILTVRIEGLAEERIVSHGIWLMPLGNGLFRAGATYEWKNLDSNPTNAARVEICQRLRDFLRLPFEVVGHDAAVRPILRHYYPVVTVHRDHPQLGFFNGLGSKGALQSPWLADHFAGFLLGDHSLDQAVSGHLYERTTSRADAIDPETGGQSIPTPPISLTEVAHSLIRAVLKPGDIAVDATVGNGHDTQFLATCVGSFGHVYGFDIQAVAIEATRQRLASVGFENVTLLHRSHAEMHEALAERNVENVKAVTLNLGYLPSGDKAVTTQCDSTNAAIRGGLSLLARGGIMTILAYTGHAGGNEEACAVEGLLKGLPITHFEVEERAAAKGRRSAPRLFVIRKHSSP
jgi:glycine oxidase